MHTGWQLLLNTHQMNIRVLTLSDWPMVKAIYEQGIATGNATFQTEAPSREEWDKAHLSSCRFVIEMDGIVRGWAALSPVSSRCVYAGVAEVSIYVSPEYSGKGIGTALLDKLIVQSGIEGLWTLQAGIFPENKASVHLHKQAGFREVGYREKIGKMKEVWRDTLLLERRNPKII
jgi:L-amino acid N-acyltransferase YncA